MIAVKKKIKKDKFKEKKIISNQKVTTQNDKQPSLPVMPKNSIGRKIYLYVMENS